MGRSRFGDAIDKFRCWGLVFGLSLSMVMAIAVWAPHQTVRAQFVVEDEVVVVEDARHDMIYLAISICCMVLDVVLLLHRTNRQMFSILMMSYDTWFISLPLIIACIINVYNRYVTLGAAGQYD